jgi:hypothetical protein
MERWQRSCYTVCLPGKSLRKNLGSVDVNLTINSKHVCMGVMFLHCNQESRNHKKMASVVQSHFQN